MILGPDGNPAPRKGNPIGNAWKWATTSMHEGMTNPGRTLMGGFGIWCLIVGAIAISGGVTWMLVGRGTIDVPIVNSLTQAGENGGVLGAISNRIRGNNQPREGGIYDEQ